MDLNTALPPVGVGQPAPSGYNAWIERCLGLRTVGRWSRMLTGDECFPHPAVRATVLMDFRADLEEHFQQQAGAVRRERFSGCARGVSRSELGVAPQMDDRLQAEAELRERMVLLSEAAYAYRVGGALPRGFAGEMSAFLDDLECYNGGCLSPP